MQNGQQIIYQKLESFIRKYHFNELVKGCLLFVGVGLSYFLLNVVLEYLLWLSVFWRTFLFWLFIGVELFFLIRWIVWPSLKLFKLRKGLDHVKASRVIGAHFPEVSDKLLNFLQLSSPQDSVQSAELLQASIEQKAAQLKFVPFETVVNHRKNYRLLPLAIIPILVVAYFFILPEKSTLSDSYLRLVQYSQPFSPPPPYMFSVQNRSLVVKQNQDFVLDIKIEGKVLPTACSLVIDGQEFFAEQITLSHYRYTFSQVQKDISFYIKSNQVVSEPYVLKVWSVPTVVQLSMLLQYPEYLRKVNQIITGSGNAVVPEGTLITWKIQSKATEKIQWSDDLQAFLMVKEAEEFKLTKRLMKDIDYKITSSNQQFINHEKLSFSIKVLKDEYPNIVFKDLPDSLSVKGLHVGQITDDYGFQRFQVVYYPINQPESKMILQLPFTKENVSFFTFSLSELVSLTEGKHYNYYFEVFDNDRINHFKSTKSNLFSTYVKTQQEQKAETLQNQKQAIAGLGKSLSNQNQQVKSLDKLQQLTKEKKELDYKDQLRIQDFLEKQQQQDLLMKDFSKKLQDNLQDFQPDKKDDFKEQLLERLAQTEKKLEQNQKILEELKELNQKLDNQDLKDKLERLKNQSKSQTKSLQQLLELTKKFYVEKKLEQISSQLDKLSETQKELSENDTKEELAKQQDLNKKFDDLKKDLNDVKKENQELKTPMSIPDSKELEKEIAEELQKSENNLKENKAQKAKANQQSAAKKMKQLSKEMSESMDSGEMEQLEEDAQMLRQVLDNLLTFSYAQENLLNQFKKSVKGSPSYAKHLKQQQGLKAQFKHIDDSLFVLSMRNPVIAENVNTEIASVFYNMDKSIDFLSDINIPRGTSHQQYTTTSANKLADFLSDALSNMQMQMNMSGSGKGKPQKGKGKEMQLPDIMEGQKGVSNKIQKGMQPKPSNSPGGKQEGQGQEGLSGEMLEIYKQQQLLRESLEKMLQNAGGGSAGKNAVEQMKQLEKQLLNKGMNQNTLKQAQQLQVELLKLDKALKQEGDENKREAQTSKTQSKNTNNSSLPAGVKEYLQSIEFLNRHQLPLQPIYNQKVQHYFKSHD